MLCQGIARQAGLWPGVGGSLPMLVAAHGIEGLDVMTLAMPEPAQYEAYAAEVLRHVIRLEARVVAVTFRCSVIEDGRGTGFLPGSAPGAGRDGIISWARDARGTDTVGFAPIASVEGRLHVGGFESLDLPAECPGGALSAWLPLGLAADALEIVSRGGRDLAFASWWAAGGAADQLDPEADCPCGSGGRFASCHGNRDWL